MIRPAKLVLCGLAAAFFAGLGLPAAAQSAASSAGMVEIKTKQRFDALVTRTETAIEKHDMGLIAQASASRGAAARGIKIPGNAVLMVFRNDYAVRMLKASIPAGIEAPLRLYITENSDGTATLSYRKPSATFAPYGSADLNAMARELDGIFEKIERDATGR